MKYFYLIISLLLLTSCASYKQARQQKRAQKHINKAVAINPDILLPDTITTTITTPPRKIDTITSIKRILQTDTVVLRDTVEKVNVKLIRQKENLRVQAECPPDTVTVETPVERIVYQQNTELINALTKRAKWLEVLLYISVALNIFLTIKQIFS